MNEGRSLDLRVGNACALTELRATKIHSNRKKTKAYISAWVVVLSSRAKHGVFFVKGWNYFYLNQVDLFISPGGYTVRVSIYCPSIHFVHTRNFNLHCTVQLGRMHYKLKIFVYRPYMYFVHTG